MSKDKIVGQKQDRCAFGDCSIRALDDEKMSVELSFSSEEPYLRWYGYEVLSHQPDAVDLTRLNDAAPLLADHDTRAQIGVVEKAWIQDSRGKAEVRFSKNNPLAVQIYNDVKDGIRKKISVGYIVIEANITGKRDNEDVWTVTKWQPLEISSVAVPADNSVGVGRNLDFYKEEKMDKEIDVVALQNEARAKEQERVSEIIAIGAQFGKQDAAAKAIRESKSVDEFRAEVLDTFKAGAPIDAKAGFIGLEEKELKQYSLLRVLRALSDPTNKKAQDEASFEYEISSEAQKKTGVKAQGILVPFDVLGRAITVTGQGATGSNIVPSDLKVESFIELLRNRSAVLPYATILSGLSGDIDIPVQLTSSTAYDLSEIGAITDSEITFGQKSMSPKRIGGSVPYSKRLILQSALNVEQFIQNDLLTQITLKIDWNLLNADGTGNTPTGIRNTTGIGLVALGANGAAPTFKDLVELETIIAVQNADIGSFRYLINAKTRGYVKTTPKETGFPLYIGDGGLINGYSYVTSNQVPANLTKGTGANLSSIVFGNFADLIVGFWGGVDLIVDPYAKKKEAVVEITVNQFYDALVRRAQSFAKIDDALI